MDSRRRRSDKVVIAFQSATAIMAVVALVISLVGFRQELSGKASKEAVQLIQRQRYISSLDTCKILSHLILVASDGHAAKGHAFLKKIGLDKCNTYAGSVVKPVIRRDK